MSSVDEMCAAGTALVAAATQAGVEARLLGGVAVALHSPSTRTAPFARDYDDIDLMIEKSGRRKIDEVLSRCGYLPDVEFNNLHGATRRVYYGDHHRKLDLFIGEFMMCHTLTFNGRLAADSPTVALSDLLLTKAQIYELNRKDAYDLMALLADHDFGEGDDDRIDTRRIAEVCGADWGFWRTVMHTSHTLTEMATADPAIPDPERIVERVQQLRDELARAPKSGKWKLRAKVGDRKVWYELPEDPARHPAVA